jgi:hypothetical protein
MKLFKKTQSESVWIVVIELNLIRVQRITGGKIKVIGKKKWLGKDKLESSLIAVTKKLGGHDVEVFLADELTELHALLLPQNETEDNNLKSRLSDVLLKPLDEYGVDWKKIGQVDGKDLVQILAIDKDILKACGAAAKKNNFKIRNVSSVAMGMAANVNDNGASLLMWREGKLQVAAVYMGAVLKVIREQGNIYKDIEALLGFVRDSFGLEIKLIILEKANHKMKKDLEQKIGTEVQEREIPMGTVPMQTRDERNVDNDEKDDTMAGGKQPNVLEIHPVAPRPPLKLEKSQEENSMSVEMSQPPKKTNMKIVVIFITILVLLLGVVVGGIIVYNGATKAKQQPDIIEPEVTPAPTIAPTLAPSPDTNTASPSAKPKPSASPTALNKAKVKIDILNGSGVPGSAGKVETLLTQAGFKTMDTGNADNFDYPSMQISVKTGQDELLTMLKDAVKSKYTVGQANTNLPASSKFDAVITVGKE